MIKAKKMKFSAWSYFCECGEHWLYQGGRKMRYSTFEKFVREHYHENFRCAGCGKVFSFMKIAQ